MDERHVKGASVGRCMVDDEGDVGVDEQEEQDALEDGREEEHTKSLWESQVCLGVFSTDSPMRLPRTPWSSWRGRGRGRRL